MVFSWYDDKLKFKTKNIINNYEVQSFRESNTKFDKRKLWKFIKKNIIKKSVMKKQKQLFNKDVTGIVLKNIKTTGIKIESSTPYQISG